MKQHRPKEQSQQQSLPQRTADTLVEMGGDVANQFDKVAASPAGDNRIGGMMTWFEELCGQGQTATNASNSITSASGQTVQKTSKGWSEVSKSAQKVGKVKSGAGSAMKWAGRGLSPFGVWDAAGGLGEAMTSTTLDTGERAVKGLENGMAFAGSALGISEIVASGAGVLTGGGGGRERPGRAVDRRGCDDCGGCACGRCGWRDGRANPGRMEWKDAQGQERQGEGQPHLQPRW